MAHTGAAEVIWRERSGSCAGEKAEAAATRAAMARVRSIFRGWGGLGKTGLAFPALVCVHSRTDFTTTVFERY